MWHVFQDITRNMWHVFHEGGYITYIWLALDVMSQVYSNRTWRQSQRPWRREEIAQVTATSQHGCAIRPCYKTKARPIAIIYNLTNWKPLATSSSTMPRHSSPLPPPLAVPQQTFTKQTYSIDGHNCNKTVRARYCCPVTF